MHSRILAGRSVLIVEDEPLIAFDIIQAFEGAGAEVKAARTLAEAKCLVEGDGLSGAVIDFGLGNDEADGLCDRLTERKIPFVLHSGFSHVGDACRSGIVVPKPANPTRLVDALAEALER